MKQFKALSCALSFTTLLVAAGAQTQESKIGFGINSTTHMLFGDNDADTPVPGGNLQLSFALVNKLKLDWNAGYGLLPFKAQNPARALQTNFYYSNLSFDYEMASSSFTPFLLAGGGIMNFRAAQATERYFDGQALLGLGFRYYISNSVALSVSGTGLYTTTDDLDGITSASKDKYLTLQAGLTFFRRGSSDVSSDPYLTDNMNMSEFTAEKTTPPPVEPERRPKADTESEKWIEQMKWENKKAIDDSLREVIAALKKAAAEAARRDSINMSTIVDRAWDTTEPSPLPPTRQKQEPVQETRKITPAKPSRNPAPAINVSEAYSRALAFYNKSNFRDAISSFEMLAENYPSHTLTSNFHYWIGESYYGQAKYEAAILSFQKVMQYKGSSKLDDALIMTGRAAQQVGQKTVAIEAFSKLIKQFPGSEFASKAKESLARMQNQ